MKDLYFRDEKLNIGIRKATFLVTGLMSFFFPKLSNHIARKYLMNPFSNRKYEFKRNQPLKSYNVDTQLGHVKLYKFGLGERTVVLTHGWGDSSRRFDGLIDYLLINNYTVWSFDHIGHGKSEGSSSNLFYFIVGLKAVIKFLEENSVKIDAMVSHSMGAVAILNSEENFFKGKRFVFISSPMRFFRSIFRIVRNTGVSLLMMRRLLEALSSEFNAYWKDLSPSEHQYKISENFMYVHDVGDRQALFEETKAYVEKTPARFFKTEGLDHLGTMNNQEVFKVITEFINEPAT